MEPQLENTDLEKRCAAIKLLAEQTKVPLSQKIVLHLAQSHHEPDSHEIKAVLVRFQSYASLMNVELTEEITDALFMQEAGFCDRLPGVL